MSQVAETEKEINEIEEEISQAIFKRGVAGVKVSFEKIENGIVFVALEGRVRCWSSIKRAIDVLNEIANRYEFQLSLTSKIAVI